MNNSLDGEAIITGYKLTSGFTSDGSDSVSTTPIFWKAESKSGPNSTNGTIDFRNDQDLEQPFGVYDREKGSIQTTLPASLRKSILHCLESGESVYVQFRVDPQDDKKLIFFHFYISIDLKN